MQVESASGRSILDMTWAQVKDIQSNLRMHRRLEAGMGLDHSDLIRLQKLADGVFGGEQQPSDAPAQQTFK